MNEGKESSISVSEAYNELLKYYSHYYVSPRVHLERLIKRLIDEGLSRDEAIIQLYRETFLKLKTAREKTQVKPKVSIIDLFFKAVAVLPNNSSLVMLYLLREAIRGLSDFVKIIVIIMIAFKLDELGVLSPLIPAAIGILNGLMLGLSIEKYTLMEFTTVIMSHGAVEIPCLVISLAAGLKLGRLLFKSLDELVSEIKYIAYVVVGIAPIMFMAVILNSTIISYLINILLH